MRSAAKRIVHKQPVLIPVPQKRKYEVAEDYDFRFRVGPDEHRVAITVPRGFRYDGASIPPAGWHLTFTPFNPMVMLPALVHDYLYGMPLYQVDRATADSLMYHMLRENGVDRITAEIMYRAVRVGGRGHWQR